MVEWRERKTHVIFSNAIHVYLNMSSCILFYGVIRPPSVFLLPVSNSLHSSNKKNLHKGVLKSCESRNSEVKNEIVLGPWYAPFNHTQLPVHFVHIHTHPGSLAVRSFGSTLAGLLDEEAALHVQFLYAGSDLPVPHWNWSLRKIMAQLQKQQPFVKKIARHSIARGTRHTICFAALIYILEHHTQLHFVMIRN